MFHNCKNMYLKSLPTMVTFSGTTGLLAGFCSYGNNSIINGDKDNRKNLYAYLIGCTSLGILTGVTYPISFPLCTYYMLK